MSEVISERRLRRLDYYQASFDPPAFATGFASGYGGHPTRAACVTFIRADAQFSAGASVLTVRQPHLEVLRERAIIARDLPKEADLTIREAQVITMAATGRSNADIGRLHSCRPPRRQAPRARLSQASRGRQVRSSRVATSKLRPADTVIARDDVVSRCGILATDSARGTQTQKDHLDARPLGGVHPSMARSTRAGAAAPPVAAARRPSPRPLAVPSIGRPYVGRLTTANDFLGRSEVQRMLKARVAFD